MYIKNLDRSLLPLLDLLDLDLELALLELELDLDRRLLWPRLALDLREEKNTDGWNTV